MNKEQKTIAAIQKAVPDIMKIERGCEIKTLKSHLEIEVGTKGIIIDKRCLGYSDVLYYNSARTILYNCDNEDLEIIGRPITLEDVLVACYKKNVVFIQSGYKTGYFTIKKGNIYKDDCKIKINSTTPRWEFNKPFSEQSKETKELIGDLILK